VAIKALRPELASQPQVVERFRSEAVTLAKLNHPNIATLYSFMRQGESFIMVLEFVRGVTLDHVIQQRGAIPVEQAVPIFCQMLDGIQEAHNYGIIHRDIKPANMMLTEKGTLKVLDFGIARILGTARMTRQGNIIGTIEYMSPEQVRGFETDARSDIYSLGMLLYEMVTGRCPFDIQNEFELMKAQIEQYPVPPRQLNPALPEVVEQAVWKSIHKDPAQRFQSAAEFRTFLLNAGFAATGRIEPLAVGDPNAFGTRPTSTPPSSYPPSPFATTPMQPGFHTQPQPGTPSNPGAPPQQQGATVPSQPGLQSAPTQLSNPGVNAPDPLAATIIDQPKPPASTSKETRVGTPAPPPAAAAATAGGGAKETRVGPAPVAPQPFVQRPPQPGFPAQQHPVRPQAGSKKWIYIAGAGVAAVVVLGVLVVGGAFFFLRGNGGPAPVKPAALADKPAAPQPTTEQPQPAPTAAADASTTQPADGAQTPAGGGTTADTTNVPGGTQGTPLAPLDPPANTGNTTTTAGTSTGSQGTNRTTAPKPAQPKQPRAADSSADAARKRREAALRALDQ
jgi:serine/threonine-protein kinase